MNIQIQHDPIKNALKVTIEHSAQVKNLKSQIPVKKALYQQQQMKKVPVDKRGIPFSHPTITHAGGA